MAVPALRVCSFNLDLSSVAAQVLDCKTLVRVIIEFVEQVVDILGDIGA